MTNRESIPVRTRLKEIRERDGISAAELARRTGVTRQTIYAMEDGSFVPNTAISLRLSRALGVKVEEIFSLSEERDSDTSTAELLATGPVFEGQLVRLCRVNNEMIAATVSPRPSYLPMADGVILSRRKTTVTVKAAPRREASNTLLLAGCDPALSLLETALPRSEFEMVSVAGTSRRALEWLKQGRVHAAGSHLRDRVSGEYNLPIVRRLLAGARIRVVHFAAWEEGFVVRPGNPKRIRSAADLSNARIKISNREKGSGSRDLLDSALRAAGVKGHTIEGYQSIASGHLAAAAEVARGGADCCVAPRSASRCFGLDFVPLMVERFDIAVSAEAFESRAGKALLDLLNRTNFKQKLQCLAGYDTSHTGELLM